MCVAAAYKVSDDSPTRRPGWPMAPMYCKPSMLLKSPPWIGASDAFTVAERTQDWDCLPMITLLLCWENRSFLPVEFRGNMG